MKKQVVYFEVAVDKILECYDVNGTKEFNKKLRQLRANNKEVIVLYKAYDDGSFQDLS